MRITTQKISEKEALERYSDLIAPDITELENAKGKGKNERHKILEVLENLKSVFTGVYLHCKDVPSESEESIVEREKLRRQRPDEIANRDKMIDPKLFREYLEYLSPSDMHKNLNKTIDLEENEAQVNGIKDKLANLMEVFKSIPTSDTKKIRKRNNMQEIVECIIDFNQLNQSGQGLKILTPKQILSRLPIFFSSIKSRK